MYLLTEIILVLVKTLSNFLKSVKYHLDTLTNCLISLVSTNPYFSRYLFVSLFFTFV